MLQQFVECVRCYYVERKVFALCCGGAIFTGMFFGLQTLALTKFLVVLLSVIFALIGGNVVYVLTSESYFLPCCRDSSNAFGDRRIGIANL